MKVKVRKVYVGRSEKLFREVIKDAVCAGVLQAETKRGKLAKDKIKNTKLTKWEKTKVAFWWVLAVSAFLVSVAVLLASNNGWIERVGNAGKYCVIGFLFVFVARMEQAMCKNKDRQFAYNMLTLLIAFTGLVMAIIS